MDTDVACLSADVPHAEIVLGRESEQYLGSAILKFPAGHPAMRDAYSFWHANRHVEQWGYTGPQSITRVALAHGLQDCIVPASCFYPILWDEAPILLNSVACTRVEEIMAGKPFLHVWMSGLQKLGVPRDVIPPPGCYLHKVMGANIR